tara:strand:+ start:361 stop:504 length:144 start_codon:yes stop_codon:yes gene_type:complete
MYSGRGFNLTNDGSSGEYGEDAWQERIWVFHDYLESLDSFTLSRVII